MGQTLMTIPLCDLMRAKTNVRKTGAQESVDALAASIDAHGLLQNLTVRQTGTAAKKNVGYEVVAGGRRLAALKLLVKRKKLARDAPVSCLVLDQEEAEEISLAENVMRVPLHPADQFEAFNALYEKGLSIAEIAARFGVADHAVKQRLRLAGVSPKLIAEYRACEMGLDQLMAFTVTDDHEAQEQVWYNGPLYNRRPTDIRMALTNGQVDGRDRRVRFVGREAYEAAGGVYIADLFDEESGGYFSNVMLLDRLTMEKLEREAEAIRAEGWSWVEVLPQMDYDRLTDFRRLAPDENGLSDDEEARLSSLAERYDELAAALEEGDDEGVSELDTVEQEMNELLARKTVWSADAKAIAGAIVTLDRDGMLSVTRGLAEPEKPVPPTDTAEKPRKAPSLSEALIEDLTAHKTAALRELVAGSPKVALTALLHTLVSRLFFGVHADLCVEIRPVEIDLSSSSETVSESRAAEAVSERHRRWSERLPERSDLFRWISELDDNERGELLAFCVASTVNAVDRRRQFRSDEWRTQATEIAEALALDMADWWAPTTATYLARVSKAYILGAVSEGVSPQAADSIAKLKKDAMAKRAEVFLEGSRWLPEPIRR